MVSRSSSIWKRAAAHICIMPSSDRRLIDLYGFFGSMPVGFNHPHFDNAAVQRDLLRAAKVKDRELGRLLGGLRGICGNVSSASSVCRRSNATLFIEGGALAVENCLKAAMDWKVRKNMAASHGRARHADFAFPSRISRTQRLHDEPYQHRSAQDGFVCQVRLAARFVSLRSIFRLPESEREADVIDREKKSEQEIREHIDKRQDRHLRHHHRADPGRRRRQSFPRRMVANAAKNLRRKRNPSHFRRSAMRDGRDRSQLVLRAF